MRGALLANRLCEGVLGKDALSVALDEVLQVETEGHQEAAGAEVDVILPRDGADHPTDLVHQLLPHEAREALLILVRDDVGICPEEHLHLEALASSELYREGLGQAVAEGARELARLRRSRRPVPALQPGAPAHAVDEDEQVHEEVVARDLVDVVPMRSHRLVEHARDDVDVAGAEALPERGETDDPRPGLLEQGVPEETSLCLL